MNISPLMLIQMALEDPSLAARYMASMGKPPPPLENLNKLSIIPAMPQAEPGTGMPGSDQMQGPLIPPAPVMPNNFAQSLNPETALPAMGDVPTVPDFMGGQAPRQPGQPLPDEGSKRGQATSAQPPVQYVPVPVPVPVPQAASPTGPRGPAGGQPYGVPAAPVQTPMMAAPQQPQADFAGSLLPMPAPTEIGALPMPPQVAAMPAAVAPVTPAGGPSAGMPAMDGLMAAMAGLAPPGGGGGGATRIGAAPAPFQNGAIAPATLQILQQILQGAAQAPTLASLMR
jgi:hypothetical protein